MLNKSYVFYYISLGNREIEKPKLKLPRFLESVLDGFEERSYKPSHKVQLLEILYFYDLNYILEIEKRLETNNVKYIKKYR